MRDQLEVQRHVLAGVREVLEELAVEVDRGAVAAACCNSEDWNAGYEHAMDTVRGILEAKR